MSLDLPLSKQATCREVDDGQIQGSRTGPKPTPLCSHLLAKRFKGGNGCVTPHLAQIPFCDVGHQFNSTLFVHVMY